MNQSIEIMLFLLITWFISLDYFWSVFPLSIGLALIRLQRQFIYINMWWYHKNHKNASARKMEIAHNSGFKYLLGISRYERTSPIFMTLNVPSYQQVYRKAL